MTGRRPDREFEEGLPAETRDVVRALRDVVRRAAPQAEESLLWGSLSYHRPAVGGRVKGAVCLVTAKHGRVRLEFIHGVRLPDPQGVLRGSLVSKRFVEIDTVADAKRPEIAALVREAAAFDPSGPDDG